MPRPRTRARRQDPANASAARGMYRARLRVARGTCRARAAHAAGVQASAGGVRVDAMRGAWAMAVTCWVASCAATEGPLLRATGAGNAAAAGAAGSAGSSGAAVAGSAGFGGSTAGSGGTSPPAGPIVPGMTFQYQISGNVDTSVDAELFVIDLFNPSDAVIAALRSQGRVLACYVSAGTRENFRDDAPLFPASAVGEPLESYPNERWLDVRDPGVRAQMATRLDLARDRGFDAVLPTNLYAYQQDSGFDLSAADQLDYARWLATEARARGLSPGMADNWGQVAELVDWFDWAVHYNCIANGDCAEMAPFVDRGKPAFDLEYEGEIDALCAEAASQGVNMIRKREQLDAFRQACP